MAYDTLEYGIIVGHLVGVFEGQGIITFTKDFDYDGEFTELASQLIKEFESPDNTQGYFSEFVKERLPELELERKKSE